MVYAFFFLPVVSYYSANVVNQYGGRDVDVFSFHFTLFSFRGVFFPLAYIPRLQAPSKVVLFTLPILIGRVRHSSNLNSTPFFFFWFHFVVDRTSLL